MYPRFLCKKKFAIFKAPREYGDYYGHFMLQHKLRNTIKYNSLHCGGKLKFSYLINLNPKCLFFLQNKLKLSSFLSQNGQAGRKSLVVT